MGVVPWPMGPNPHAQNWPLGYRGPPRLDPPQQHRNSGNTRCSRPNKILVMSNFAEECHMDTVTGLLVLGTW